MLHLESNENNVRIIKNYLLTYMTTYESQYNQTVNHVIISGLKKSGQRIARLILLEELESFLNSTNAVTFTYDKNSKELILNILISTDKIDFKIYKVSEEKDRRFGIIGEKEVTELKLNYWLDNLNTVKFKENIFRALIQ